MEVSSFELTVTFAMVNSPIVHRKRQLNIQACVKITGSDLKPSPTPEVHLSSTEGHSLEYERTVFIFFHLSIIHAAPVQQHLASTAAHLSLKVVQYLSQE